MLVIIKDYDNWFNCMMIILKVKVFDYFNDMFFFVDFLVNRILQFQSFDSSFIYD